MTTLLLDGDILAYRAAGSCEPTKAKPEREPESEAEFRLSESIHRILNRFENSEYRFFISGSDNFRKVLYPDYKANRVSRKPEWLDTCRNILIDEWKAEVSTGCEADDRIGIAAHGDFIICSIDKDFKQIPGWHYNHLKDLLVKVSPKDAYFAFYEQMLIGDVSDNVPGVAGIGPVKATRELSGKTPGQVEAHVQLLFGSREAHLLSYNLLRLTRSEEELEYIETCIREHTIPEITKERRFAIQQETIKFDGEEEEV